MWRIQWRKIKLDAEFLLHDLPDFGDELHPIVAGALGGQAVSGDPRVEEGASAGVGCGVLHRYRVHVTGTSVHYHQQELEASGWR